jgi:hypothetical protein
MTENFASRPKQSAQFGQENVDEQKVTRGWKKCIITDFIVSTVLKTLLR